jgi:hypothetical protein
MSSSLSRVRTAHDAMLSLMEAGSAEVYLADKNSIVFITKEFNLFTKPAQLP